MPREYFEIGSVKLNAVVEDGRTTYFARALGLKVEGESVSHALQAFAKQLVGPQDTPLASCEVEATVCEPPVESPTAEVISNAELYENFASAAGASYNAMFGPDRQDVAFARLPLLVGWLVGVCRREALLLAGKDAANPWFVVGLQLSQDLGFDNDGLFDFGRCRLDDYDVVLRLPKTPTVEGEQ